MLTRTSRRRVSADANGVSTLKQSFNHLAQTGRLIVYGFHSMLPRKGASVALCVLAT